MSYQEEQCLTLTFDLLQTLSNETQGHWPCDMKFMLKDFNLKPTNIYKDNIDKVLYKVY